MISVQRMKMQGAGLWRCLGGEVKEQNAKMSGTLGTVGTLARFLGKFACFPECLRVPRGTVGGKKSCQLSVHRSSLFLSFGRLRLACRPVLGAGINGDAEKSEQKSSKDAKKLRNAVCDSRHCGVSDKPSASSRQETTSAESWNKMRKQFGTVGTQGKSCWCEMSYEHGACVPVGTVAAGLGTVARVSGVRDQESEVKREKNVANLAEQSKMVDIKRITTSNVVRHLADLADQ